MTKPLIHPTAIIDPKAELDSTVQVGPYAIVEADVSIGAGTKIGPHVHIEGITSIGCDNEIGTGSTIGHAPQHLAYKGEPRRFSMGDRNKIREYVALHRGFLEGEGTTLGNDGYYMTSSHVGHDCVVGDHVVVLSNAAFGGHCLIGDHVFCSGQTLIHQFCRVGANAFIGFNTKVDRDVPPFMIAEGLPACLRGINARPLPGRGISSDGVKALQAFFRKVYKGEGTFRQRFEEFSSGGTEVPEVQAILDFYADENYFGKQKRGMTAAGPKAK